MIGSQHLLGPPCSLLPCITNTRKPSSVIELSSHKCRHPARFKGQELMGPSSCLLAVALVSSVVETLDFSACALMLVINSGWREVDVVLLVVC